MRKTEVGFGIGAGAAGVIIAGLLLAGLLPYAADTLASQSADMLRAYAIFCMIVNMVGIAGAILVRTHHILGSAVMAAVMISLLFYGFPWQSISAVAYIISIVMALVPVKTST